MHRSRKAPFVKLHLFAPVVPRPAHRLYTKLCTRVNQNSNLKMQNDNSKFKEEFTKRLVQFSLETIRLCQEMRQRGMLRPLADQLIRSSTSVGANVVEAKSSGSKKEYIHYFEIALKSANETKYWFILIKESEKDLSGRVETLLKEMNEISNILASSILTMKGKRNF